MSNKYPKETITRRQFERMVQEELRNVHLSEIMIQGVTWNNVREMRYKTARRNVLARLKKYNVFVEDYWDEIYNHKNREK